MDLNVVVIRHPRENIKKCSMSHLHEHKGFQFLTASDGFSFDATGYMLLELDAPPVTPADANLPILMPDSTWALLPKVRGKIAGTPVPRSIPAGVRGAYPRASKMHVDPSGGLATLEALYAALKAMGISAPEILKGWHFAEDFLRLNNWPDDLEKLKGTL